MSNLTNILQKLESTRLLTYDGENYELSHDTLAHKIAEKRSAEEKALIEWELLIKNKLRASAQAASPDYLTAAQLTGLADLEHKLFLDKEEKEFVATSSKYVAEQERKAKARRRLILGGVSLFALVLFIGIILIYNQYQRAQDKELQARISALNAKSVIALNENDPYKAYQIAQDAYALDTSNFESKVSIWNAYYSGEIYEWDGQRYFTPFVITLNDIYHIDTGLEYYITNDNLLDVIRVSKDGKKNKYKAYIINNINNNKIDTINASKLIVNDQSDNIIYVDTLDHIVIYHIPTRVSKIISEWNYQKTPYLRFVGDNYLISFYQKIDDGFVQVMQCGSLSSFNKYSDTITYDRIVIDEDFLLYRKLSDKKAYILNLSNYSIVSLPDDIINPQKIFQSQILYIEDAVESKIIKSYDVNEQSYNEWGAIPFSEKYLAEITYITDSSILISCVEKFSRNKHMMNAGQEQFQKQFVVSLNLKTGNYFHCCHNCRFLSEIDNDKYLYSNFKRVTDYTTKVESYSIVTAANQKILDLSSNCRLGSNSKLIKGRYLLSSQGLFNSYTLVDLKLKAVKSPQLKSRYPFLVSEDLNYLLINDGIKKEGSRTYIINNSDDTITNIRLHSTQQQKVVKMLPLTKNERAFFVNSELFTYNRIKRITTLYDHLGIKKVSYPSRVVAVLRNQNILIAVKDSSCIFFDKETGEKTQEIKFSFNLSVVAKSDPTETKILLRDHVNEYLILLSIGGNGKWESKILNQIKAKSFIWIDDESFLVNGIRKWVLNGEQFVEAEFPEHQKSFREYIVSDNRILFEYSDGYDVYNPATYQISPLLNGTEIRKDILDISDHIYINSTYIDTIISFDPSTFEELMDIQINGEGFLELDVNPFQLKQNMKSSIAPFMPFLDYPQSDRTIK